MTAQSIFAGQSGPFAEYRLEIEFRDRVLGGKPKDPKIVQKWIEQQVEGRDRKDQTKDDVYEIVARAKAKEFIRQTETEKVGGGGNGGSVEVSPEALPELNAIDEMPLEEVEALISKYDLMLASGEQVERSGNGFNADENGLYLGGYQLKAALKESTNIVFVGETFGPTRKGAKAFVSERVFVKEDRLYLGTHEADGVQTITGTVIGKGGPRSIMTMYEYVEAPKLAATIRVTRDHVPAHAWPHILMSMEEVGMGAARNQGFGTFNVTGWERVRDFRPIK